MTQQFIYSGIYSFSEWTKIYNTKKKALTRRFNQELKAIIKILERERFSYQEIEEIEESLNRLRALLRNLHGFGDLYPIEILYFCEEMEQFNYQRHLDELHKYEDVLIKISMFKCHKEDYSVKMWAQYTMDILQCIGNIVLSWE